MANFSPRAEPCLAEDLDHILAHTEGLWEPLRGETVFVTGGTGFFGRWLLESFAHSNARLDLNARMIVLSRDPDSFLRTAPHLRNETIQFIRGDVRTFEFHHHQPIRYVIHAATEASAKLNDENPLLMVDTIVEGTRHTLEFAIAAGAKRFLLTSSGAVYGRQPGDLTHVAETYSGSPDPTDANSAYGEGKRLAELLCACFAKQHGLECLIARCFAFVGPFLPLDTHFAIGNFIRDALRGGPIQVNGDGTPYRSYLYAADLAIWLWTILFSGKSMRPYNVGSDCDLSIEALAHIVAKTHASLPVTIRTPSTSTALPSRYVPDCRRAHEELQLECAVDLETSIRRTAAFQRYFA